MISLRALTAAIAALLIATPAHALRELSTDRPDRTESPYTVDRGHVQVEIDAAAWTQEKRNEFFARSLSVATTNLKFGLFARSDLQLVIGAWNQDRYEDRGAHLNLPGLVERVQTTSSIGDLAIRWKQNLFGNDGGKVAMALMPFVQVPLEDYEFDRMEGGLIVPVAFEGPAGFGFGVMGELDVRRDDETDRGHHAEYIFSGTASHAIAGPLGGYLEIFSLSRSDAGVPWTGTFDVGLTYGIGENVQLDGGANFGLSLDTEDVTVFLGVSARR
jgi:hypothetical protein